MGSADGLGTRAARFTPAGADDPVFRARMTEVLAENDESVLAAFVDAGGVPYPQLRSALAAQTRRALVHPVFLGSALTGAGVEPLMAGIVELLPVAEGDAEGDLAGSVFKIERGAAGEKISYSAGEIAKLWGLGGTRVGDPIGEARAPAPAREFAPPTLETAVVALDPADRARLRFVLGQLAEQDPLIDVRQDDARGEISVSLYGEVQKEVLGATLADDHGLRVAFRETTTICVERPLGTGEALELLHGEANPFSATVGLRVAPGVAGSGLEFRLEVANAVIPLYAFRTRELFAESMARYARETLREGLSGWQVTDCVVTMTRCGYASADGPPSTRGSLSTPADYQRLTPLVLARALQRAGTTVCEPVARATLEIPTDALGAVMRALGRFGAAVEQPSLQGRLAGLEAILPAARVHELQRRLPALTGGEGVLEAVFAGYRPVSGSPPTRRRTTPSPLNREEYLLHLARRVGSAGRHS
jgi:ribosomal protection tetracycline resistance protein